VNNRSREYFKPVPYWRSGIVVSSNTPLLHHLPGIFRGHFYWSIFLDKLFPFSLYIFGLSQSEVLFVLQERPEKRDAGNCSEEKTRLLG
jgi:hypothetical protein